MTVPSEESKWGPYACNGVTPVFPYGGRIFADTDLSVILRDSNGVETALTLGVDYTVDGVNSPGGGAVTTNDVYPAGNQIMILRRLPLTQQTELVNQGPLYAETLEDQFDRLVMLAQQSTEESSRALKLRPSDADDGSGIYQAGRNRIGDLGAPEALDDAASRRFVENTLLGATLPPLINAQLLKAPARVVAAVNVTLAGLGNVIDGVVVAADDRILATAQVLARNNGLWIAQAGAWVRPLDFDSAADLLPGLMVPITEGSQAGRVWALTTAAPITLGVTSLSFAPVLQAGEAAAYAATASAGAVSASAGAASATASAATAVAASDAAAISSGNAAAAAATATTAKNEAVAAADTVFLMSPRILYPDTAAALADSATLNKYFYTPFTSDTRFAQLWLNNAGIAQAINVTASKGAIDAMQPSIDALNAAVVRTDLAGWKIAFLVGGVITGGVRDDGTHEAARQRLVNAAGDEVVMRVNDQGALVVEGAVVQRAITLPADCVLIAEQGQSNARANLALPVTAGTPGGAGVGGQMFIGGARPDDADSDEGSPFSTHALSALVDYVSQVSPVNGALGEQKLHAAIAMVYQLLQEEDGLAPADISFRLLGVAPGRGSQALANLAEGTVYFERHIQAVAAGLARNQALDRSFAVGPMIMDQGQQDMALGTARATYLAELIAHRQRHEARCRLVMGQPGLVVPMLVCQTGANSVYGGAALDICAAQMDAERQDPAIHVAATEHHVPFADSVHNTTLGQRWKGAQIGVAWKRYHLDKRPVPKCRITAWSVQGRLIDLIFNTDIEHDTNIVTDPGNKGFGLVAADGTALALASAPVITAPRRLRLVATAPLPAGARLQIAKGIAGNWSGPTTGGRCTIRDKQGYSIVFDRQGDALPIFNWLPADDFVLVPA